jgi:hypothetical protein
MVIEQGLVLNQLCLSNQLFKTLKSFICVKSIIPKLEM